MRTNTRHKNKLTTILRKCEKNYNTKLLELNKGNLKETWKLLNSIINTKKKTMQVGNEFENKGESVTGDEHIANGFNNYFVNVGPSLADNIPDTDTQFSQYLSASTNVKNSLFLNPVTDVDILQLVAKVKPKKSKGHDELDMCLIKKLIPYRGRPWRYSVIPSTPDFPTEYQIRWHSNPAGLPTFAAIWGPDFRASIIRLTCPHVFKQINKNRITLMMMFKANRGPPN